MRATRYLLIVAAILAVLAAVAWYLRDGLIQRFSNPRLAQYGIAITDVSLDALAGGGARIGYLELVHESGTTIAIENLRLPISKPSSDANVFSAGSVTITRSLPRDETPPDIASLLEQLLSLPEDLGGNELRVDDLKAPPYPAIQDLRWTLLDDEQIIRARINSVPVELAIASTEAGHYELTLASRSVLQASIDRQDSGYAAVGASSFDLPDFAPFAKLAGIVPDEIDIQSGTGQLNFTMNIPFDASSSPSVTAQLAPLSPIRLTYKHTSGETTLMVVHSASALEVLATFPEIDWSILQAESSLRVSYAEWQDVPLEIGALSCTAGPVCTMSVRTAYDEVELPVGEIAGASFDANITVRFDDQGPVLDIEPGATLQARDFATRDTNVASIMARLESAGEFALTNAGWRLSAGTITSELDAVMITNDISLGAALRFEDVSISELDGVTDVRSGVSAPLLTAQWADHIIELPGITGELRRQAARASVNLETTGLERDGRIEASHNLDSGYGTMSVSELTLSFVDRKLSDRISPWRHDWDLAGGSASASAQANWRPSNGALVFDGQASTRLDQLAGYYGDSAFAGMSTVLAIMRERAGSLQAGPSSITVQLLEIGVPVENIRADFELDLENLSIDIDNLRMSALDGTVQADPFSFHTRKDANTLVLRADSIDLATLLTTAEFEAVEVSGLVAAVLPVTITRDSIIVNDGTLTGEPPGGVIRYLPGQRTAETDVSGLGLAARALSNLEYDSLTSAVNYSDEGDMRLQLRISGRNPDMDDGRPIVLNLDVENNVPKMLKSLRAARNVEDILQQRIER